jgi:hypothetical protein
MARPYAARTPVRMSPATTAASTSRYTTKRVKLCVETYRSSHAMTA